MSVIAKRYYERGVVALRKGDARAAEESFRAALDLAPAFCVARQALAVALVRLGDTPRAANVLRAGLGRATSAKATAMMNCLLADVLVAGGDFPGAEAALEAADAAMPGGRSWAGRARVFARTGRLAEMARALVRAGTST